MNLKSLLLIGCSAFLLLGFSAGVQDPAKLPGFGNPQLVSKDASGWAKIKFRDLGITVDLPAWPTPAEMEFDAEDSDNIKGWAGYDFSSRKITGDAYVYESVRDDGFQASDLLDQEAEGLEDQQLYSNVKTSRREFTIEGKKVHVLDASYLSGVDRTHGRAFFWQDGKKGGMLRLTWWADEHADAVKLADHIEKSLRIGTHASTR